jgi:hypothetical protein
MNRTSDRVVKSLVDKAFFKLINYRGTQHLDQLLSAYGCLGNAIQLIQKEQQET